MKSILASVLLLVIAGSIFIVAAQDRQQEKKGAMQTSSGAKSTSDQIEVVTDRFSGVTTVKLKPQVILDKPDHQMTIEIETKLGEKGKLDFEKDDVKAEVWFRSLYKGSVDFGDQELHLLIDGKPLDLGKIPGGHPEATDENMRRERGFRIKTFFVAIFDRRAMEQVGKTKSIEMRLGPIELTLGQPEVATLGEYAKQVLAQHKIASERKQ
jgi:hypothetical protein